VPPVKSITIIHSPLTATEDYLLGAVGGPAGGFGLQTLVSIVSCDSLHRLLGEIFQKIWIFRGDRERSCHQSIHRQEIECGLAGLAIRLQHAVEQSFGCFQKLRRCWSWIIVESGPHRSREIFWRRCVRLAHAVSARCLRIISGASATADAMRAASGIPA